MSTADQNKLLDYVFHCLGRFAFDRVREVCDREKDAVRNPQGFAAVWSQFLASLSQLGSAEKAYMTLAFLSQTPNNKKAFRNKEIPLRALYGQIKQDFEKTAENLNSHPDAGVLPTEISAPVLGHLCVQLVHFASARLDMCDIYERLHEMGLARTNRFQEIAGLIDQVLGTYGKRFHHPLLGALESSFLYETEILKHLIDAQLRMTEWNFMASLIHLNQSHRRITIWPNTATATEPPIPANMKLALLKTVVLPALYLWFARYQTTLLAKFSLYFHDILSKQTSVATEFRNLLAKNNPDYLSKIITFHRKHDALSVCLLLDTNGMDYRGPGYRFPGSSIEAPTGLESYPAIFSYPAERPVKHWPSIIMILTGEAKRLEDPDAVVTIFDKDLERTYFVARIEERFYIVLIFEIRKSEKDSAVNQFLHDTITQLRGSAVLESLKPV